MLKSLDLEYHNLHPERGLCYGLEEEGRGPRLTTDKIVASRAGPSASQHTGVRTR
jgi:hypothetical protein